jgi:undecaprenyl-diphosphatase
MDSKNFFNKLNDWDQKIILKVNGIGGKAFTILLKVISFLGRETIWIFLMVYYLFIIYDPRLFSYISSIFLLGVVIIAPIKKCFNRDRPFETLKDIRVLERKPMSRSFPSWHAYNVASQGLLFSFLLNSIGIAIIVLIVAILVSFSRIQLGVHYPSDVIFGSFIGIIGFVIARTILFPVLMKIVNLVEEVIEIPIYYQIINPLLIENIFYLFIVIAMLIVITLLAIHKRIIILLEHQSEK